MAYSNDPFNVTIKKLFSHKQIGIREFGKKTKVNYSYLSKLKNEKMPPPSNKVIENIAEGFNLSPEYFLEYRFRKIQQLLLNNPNIIDALYQLHEQPLQEQEKIKNELIKIVLKNIDKEE